MAAKREGEIECKGAAMSETTNYDTHQSSNGAESQRLREHADYISPARMTEAIAMHRARL
eukprot:CAMPEP_0181185248 /NCGR_PEP_ID=MMETSP1096-20121128/9404_1 /TAXON_ID=156174 ORGANISM="Chrysochromulina ericina, Strain CCMP281" /NCGR_SAMPLE_ID=MMETSP1096 /ASSEMBLY_ACC=CAM_ASM_000453 /LENGTH=59 /DNA_ID=CAMNT_0023274075 /DNA_START=186 /DNA_END=365 /DNA_ORIENTATION=+